MKRHLLLPLLLIAISLTEPALGQINPFRGGRGTPLSAGDITALTDATNRLLDQPHVASGAKETWSNPESGASGTATAGSAVKRQGLACRVVRYQIAMPNQRSERNRTLTWCKTKDGWKIA